MMYCHARVNEKLMTLLLYINYIIIITDIYEISIIYNSLTDIMMNTDQLL